jgi:hypothetical protein
MFSTVSILARGTRRILKSAAGSSPYVRPVNAVSRYTIFRFSELRHDPYSVLPMNDPHAGVRNISDTARWMAYFRAMESRRPDALFSDPYAEALAGERGFQIAKILSQGNKQEWAWVTRIYFV